MRHRKTKKVILKIVIVLALFAFAFAMVFVWSYDRPTSVESIAVTTPSPTATVSIAPSDQEPAEASLPVKHLRMAPSCARDIGQFTPVRLVIEQVGIDIPLTALPLNAQGALPVPPNFSPSTGAWWKDGAKPGDGQGVVYVGVHTYSSGYDATGNKLLRVKPGAVAKLYNADGIVGACYVFSSVIGVDPAAAPPIEGWRLDGPSGLSMMTCDLYDPKSQAFTRRDYFLWSHIW